MKVAVFGSWSDRKQDQDWYFMDSRDEFNKACKEIGRTLAENGYTLIVESEAQHVADPYVVEGYYEHAISGTLGELKIELAWPRGIERPFNDRTKARPDLFIHRRLPAPEAENQRWSNSHLVSLKHADAVLTIGGKQGAYLAGSAAILLGKPLVPIASFGGASTRLLKDLEVDRGGNLDPLYHDLNGPWSAYVLKSAVKLLGGNSSKMLIFVSHAHADVKLAEAIVDVIREAFNVSNEAIRCTSVPGFNLKAGVHTASELRSEIEKTEFVLGVLTPHSIESKYVLMELGAAWGLGKRTFPLVALGVKASNIPGPLGELHWIDLAKSQECYQLIDDLSSYKPLGDKRKLSSGAIVENAVKQLVTYAQ